ncbi:unnamed protein product [Paramecium octaurelia]|uniref:Uncharacterized protein n=1 Tax=Paramecium octaurelia TaxID=43137 RepID=A0A8S1TX74_PAROT|nr:unnamed protein product [Paramecium octaurelia]
MQGIVTEQFAGTLNHAFRELTRRQLHSMKEFDELSAEFQRHTDKMKITQTYQPIIEIFTQINKWMIDRLEKGQHFTDQIMTQKKTYDTILQQERSVCLEICKLDLNRLNSLKQCFFHYQQYLKKEWQRDFVEYQLLYLTCQEYQLDYPQLLAAIQKLEDKNNLLLDLFKSHNKERGFLYQFYLKYAKLRVQYFEATKYNGEQLKKLAIIIQRNSNGLVNMIQNDQTLQHDQLLLELQKSISFHVEIHQEILDILNQMIKFAEQSNDSLNSKYTKYMQLVLEMQSTSNQTNFHDFLMQQMSLTLSGMVQSNIVRDRCFNNFIIELSELIHFRINNLNCKANDNLKEAVQQYNKNQQLHHQMRGEQQWNDMLMRQKEIYERQLKEYQNVLQFRKQSYLKDQSRFCNNPKVINLSSLDLPLTAKEFFKLFLSSDEQNFFAQFKTNVMKEIQVKYTQYEPAPPSFFVHEENFDIKELIDQCCASKRVITYKQPNRDKLKLFSPEYVNCKCEQFVYFISDAEIMVEQEVFNDANQYCSIRKYMHIIQTNNNEVTLHYGYYKHELKFNIFGLLDYFSNQEEKDIYEQQLQPAMVKCVQQYLQNKENLKEERKKQFILNNNIDYMLNQQSEVNPQPFQPNIPFIKQANQLASNKWTMANMLSQESLMKLIFLLLLLNFFKPQVV